MSLSESLNAWLESTQAKLAAEEEPNGQHAPSFIEQPQLIALLLKQIAAIEEAALASDQSFYSACLYALDVCVGELKFAHEQGNRQAHKHLDALMAELTHVIHEGKQSINFWLPLMGVFFDAQIALSDELQEIYLTLAEEESDKFQVEGFDHLQSMRDLILELGDVSPFELTAHFFSQSHAMPAMFYLDLVVDLCQIEEAKDAAILTLLHPNAEVREVILQALDSVMPEITISSQSLSRLQAMEAWSTGHMKATIKHWVRIQRKKGVLFPTPSPQKVLKLQGSEVDGGGAEGLFMQLKVDTKVRLAGLLLKHDLGIKDAWITPKITKTETKKYYQQVLGDGVTLRTIDMPFFMCMANHFLAVTLLQGDMPNLHFLELQEVLGVHFLPEKIDVRGVMNDLSIQIQPFTPAVLEKALVQTQNWLDEKPFASSWFMESEALDKLVNRCSHIESGMKICRFDDAMQLVFSGLLEPMRERWLFHFMWVAMWLRSGARKHEKTWQSCFFLAHAIQTGMPLSDIPIMRAICHQSVVNSVETMRDRRTHLSQE